jgi:hypothetical protein
MATVLGDLKFPGGSYKANDGSEKTRWIKCGILLQTDKGMRVKLESIPVGIAPDGGWFSVFEKKDDKPVQPAKTTSAPQSEQDPIPF